MSEEQAIKKFCHANKELCNNCLKAMKELNPLCLGCIYISNNDEHLCPTVVEAYKMLNKWYDPKKIEGFERVLFLDERNAKFLLEILEGLRKDTYLDLIPEDVPRILQIENRLKNFLEGSDKNAIKK